MQRQCDQCGEPFEAKRPTAKYCSGTCRTRRSRSGPSAPPPPVVDAGPSDGLVGSVRSELEQLAQIDSVIGQHALEIAKRIVGAPGMNTGVASLSKELSRVMGEARSVSTVAADPVDDLKARRDAKRAAAAG